jgi:cobalt-zinc-cadmium efflux system outer membrane protein
MFPKPILLGGLALASSGYVHYKAQPLSSPATALERRARTLADDGLVTFFTEHQTPFPTTHWELPDLALAAFYFNPDLEVAHTHWATTTAAEITAHERPHLSLGISPGLNTSTPASGPSVWILGLNFDFPLETAGKRGHHLTQSRQLSESTRLAIASAAWHVHRAMVEIEAAATEVDLRAEQLTAETKTIAIL